MFFGVFDIIGSEELEFAEKREGLHEKLRGKTEEAGPGRR